MDTKRIKIVYLIGTLRIGGAERDIVETVTRLNKQRFAPQIYCISGGGPLQKRVESHGIPVTVFHALKPGKCDKKHIARKFFSLYHYLKKEQPSIVHSYTYSPSIYGGLAAKLATHAKIITNRLCLGTFKDGHPGLQVLENLVNRVTDNVIANAQAIKEDVLQRERIMPEKIHIIYNGVNLEQYLPVDSSTQRLKKQRFDIPETSPVIGIVANLSYWKGHREFVLAASKVVQRSPEVKFFCIGEDRGMKPQLDSLIHHLGLQKHIIFTGKIEQVEQVLPLIDIQVSASYEEGFSNAILEGMACGKPVIATAVGGTPEAVVHNETGLLVPPKDEHALAQAMLCLLAQPELAKQFGQKGRTRVEQYFSVQKMIYDLETFYCSLLTGK